MITTPLEPRQLLKARLAIESVEGLAVVLASVPPATRVTPTPIETVRIVAITRAAIEHLVDSHPESPTGELERAAANIAIEAAGIVLGVHLVASPPTGLKS